MPRISNFPPLYDECKTLSISDLLRWGYLEAKSYCQGTINWTRQGKQTGNILITANIQAAVPYVELDYMFNDKAIRYEVLLTTTPSNIGKGIYWFFICPLTGKRCRKLFLIGGFFYNRSAFKGCYYEKQTYSLAKRRMNQSFEKLFGTEKLYEELFRKHFKTTYAGKATKRYKRIWGKIYDASNVSENDILRHFRV